MNNTIKKCFNPSDKKYGFVICVLLFILGSMIYIGYFYVKNPIKLRTNKLRTNKLRTNKLRTNKIKNKSNY